MEAAANETRSTNLGPEPEECFGPGLHQSSSFTALLELPPSQVVELLVQTPEAIDTIPPPTPPEVYSFTTFAYDVPPPPPPVLFPTDMELIVDSYRKQVKQEIVDSSPTISDTTFHTQGNKRKDREKKVKESNKKNKKPAKETSEDGKKGGGGGGGEKLPYVHVRARRGQATDSHSLAERARREKINARMKLLQELVPGCNKITGTASVLDEIINHVQCLQRQVEFLSMRLAAVNPRIDINLDALMTAENGSLVESNFPGIAMPSVWPEEQIRPQYQQLWHLDGFQQSGWVKEEDNSNFVPP